MLKENYYTEPTELDILVFDKLVPPSTICVGSSGSLTLNGCATSSRTATAQRWAAPQKTQSA